MVGFKRDIKVWKFSLPCSDTLRTALSRIDALDEKMCVVHDADGNVLRTVTDGDVRRFLLAGGALDDTLDALPKKKPITALRGTSDAEQLQAMQDNEIHAIVIVDDLGAPVQIRSRTSLERKILLSPPHLGETEMTYVQGALDGNWVAPAGPNLTEFESAFAKLSARSHALAVSSGTAALHLALRVLGVEAGDRVYVSDLTFVASVQPILYQNATPVLIDSEPISWNMSPAALERKLAQDKVAGILPAAIIIVHLYGQSADMVALMELADSYGIPVIEDATESLGARIGGKPSGAHGLLSAFSFNGNKMITTSGGGALVSDRADLIDYARKLSTQGRDSAEHYQHSTLAYNYRMSNVLAGIGLGQLDVLDAHVQRRREIFDLYRKVLSDLSGVSFQGDSVDSLGCRWLTVIDCDPDVISLHPYQIMRRLSQFGIETRPAWKPMHMQPLCRNFEFVPHTEQHIVSSSLFLRSLCLPSGSKMSDQDVTFVAATIRNIIEES